MRKPTRARSRSAPCAHEHDPQADAGAGLSLYWQERSDWSPLSSVGQQRSPSTITMPARCLFRGCGKWEFQDGLCKTCQQSPDAVRLRRPMPCLCTRARARHGRAFACGDSTVNAPACFSARGMPDLGDCARPIWPAMRCVWPCMVWCVAACGFWQAPNRSVQNAATAWVGCRALP